jgi:hypothetical protein
MTKKELQTENRLLKKIISKKDQEISELIHMHREIEKRMTSIFGEVAQQEQNEPWWQRIFSR